MNCRLWVCDQHVERDGRRFLSGASLSGDFGLGGQDAAGFSGNAKIVSPNGDVLAEQNLDIEVGISEIRGLLYASGQSHVKTPVIWPKFLKLCC